MYIVHCTHVENEKQNDDIDSVYKKIMKNILSKPNAYHTTGKAK